MADEECKQEECPPGAPLWMCTFADLMSLLLCFFVLLLSFSVMDAQKYKMVQGSMKDAFGVQKQIRAIDNPSSEQIITTQFISTPLAVKVQRRIDEVVSEESHSNMIEVELSHDGALLRIKDSVAFQFGKATLRDNFKKLLAKVGKIIKEAEAKVTVIGHTDNIPLKKDGAFTSNWSLSTARSVAVVEYWADTLKIPTFRMTAVGMSDGKPIASNETSKGRAENRRVEFKIQVTQTALTFKGLSELLAK